MNQVSPVLRRGSRGFFHWCPACEMMHPLFDSAPWTFDGNVNKPTFSPSFAQGYTHWTEGVDERGRGRGERQERTCHYIITGGMIQFCPDSWHKRSDIVAMPSISPELSDRDDGFAIETQD